MLKSILQIALLCGILFLISGMAFGQKSYQKTRDGLLIHLREKKERPAELLKIQVLASDMLHILKTPDDSFATSASLMVIPQKSLFSKWEIQEKDGMVILDTDSLRATVSLNEGSIYFYDLSGKLLLKSEAGTANSFTPVEIDHTNGYRLRQDFRADDNQAFYGLGENQYGFMNLRHKNILLAQRNSEAYIPFMISTANYGLLWDNNSITRVGDARAYQAVSSLKLYDSTGVTGALNAAYISGKGSETNRISRREQTIDYTYLDSLKKMPAGFDMNHGKVEWQGYVSDDESGPHHFRWAFGGYLKVWWDGKLVLDRWRQCWNPANAETDFLMEKGKKYALKIEWKPDGSESFLSLRWLAPLPSSQRDRFSFISEMGDQVDYYFVKGQNLDEVIAHYRQLTGQAPIMPKWTMGYWQSRERYKSQQEILDIVAAYREKHIPLDNIVQDWFYWKEDQWGSQEFDPARYPDPKAMIDSLHNIYHTHFMISVWPKFYVGTKSFDDFWKKGWLYKQNVENKQKDWVGYVSTFYDAFNPNARKAFWQLIDKKLFSLGVDAWWMDATEPDILSNASFKKKKSLMNPTALGSSSKYFNAFPLENSRAVYTGQRKSDPDKRVFILTRSAFGGSQRYASATWSGDIGATWADMKNQIAAGVNFSMAGVPYWTMDIGGFATEARYQNPKGDDLDEWREQFTRWFQFGAFCPLFRAHGQLPFREIFNVAPEGSPAYRSMVYYDRLRYRLMPYLYSLSGKIFFDQYTMMRGLAMDFPKDRAALDINDEYMFGPSLLINPVYTYHAASREVYLPKGQGWYDLYSGKYEQGGRRIIADAPYTRMPVFVKAGSVIPFGPAMEYAEEKSADTIALFVYTGKDASFNIYEDENENYNYEKGAYSNIPLTYREQDHSLIIGDRKGTFPKMLQKRVFKIIWLSPDKAEFLDFNKKADAIIHYDGQQQKVLMQ